jgi:hypothetical protein
MIKAKLYQLLEAMITVNQPIILMKLNQSKILNYIIIDYEKYSTNSNILTLLNKTVKAILSTKTANLADKLLFDLGLIA